jgi:HAD superfamily phosphoserine phosphatase-like hydrolase
MILALFDLDNTLLAGDSDFEWAQYLIDRGVLDREVYEARNQQFYDQYKAGTLDIHEFLDFQLKPLSRHPRKVLDEWHADYMHSRIMPMIRQSNSFVTAPIAREFGIEHLIATDPEVRNGEFTGGVTGTPCFREGKVTRLGSWLAAHGKTLKSVSKSTFYSDSHNDLPLLEQVTHPVAVDPDASLRAQAVARGWPVMSLA